MATGGSSPRGGVDLVAGEVESVLREKVCWVSLLNQVYPKLLFVFVCLVSRMFG
jgi:hypothetical protein